MNGGAPAAPPPALITDFWEAAAPPQGLSEPVRHFRDLILRSQQPQQCTRICGIRKSLWVGGSAQNLRRLAHMLLQATLAECALVGHWPPWMYASVATGQELRAACSSSNRPSLHCYFRPPSSCSPRPPGDASSSSFSFLNSQYDLSRGLDQVANRTGLRSEVLIMGTLLSWIMRPEPELASAVRRYGAALGFDENDRAFAGARHRNIALHMRRGDKYSLHAKHMRNHTWRVSPEAYVAWGRRVAADIGAERVLFMTDDPAVDLEALSGRLFRSAPAPRACTPSYLAASAVRATKGATHTSAAKGLHTLGAHPEIVADRTRGREAELARDCGPSLFVDDGIQLFAGMLLLAQCAAFIGTQISNIGAAIVELMATHSHPPVFHDVLNDVHRAFLSDERVWYGGVHNPSSIRPLHVERLAFGDGTTTHGTWMEPSSSKTKSAAKATFAPSTKGAVAMPVQNKKASAVAGKKGQG